MWIHFDLKCNAEKQFKLHKVFRDKIRNWEDKGLINGAILTYHYSEPHKPTDSLYVCLNIPSVKKPNKRSILLKQGTIKLIPSEILDSFEKLINENQIEF